MRSVVLAAVLTVADDPQAGADRRRRRRTSPTAGLGHHRDADRARRRRLRLDPPEHDAGAVEDAEPTNANGFAQFQWEPIPPEEDSTATVAEATRTRLHRRADRDRQRLPLRAAQRGRRRPGGRGRLRPTPRTRRSSSTRSGRRSSPARSTTPSTTHPTSQLTKVNRPTEVRGDLDPPASGHLDLHGHQPRQHPADERHRHRRPLRAGRARACDRRPNVGDDQRATACSTPARRGSSPAPSRCGCPGPTDPAGRTSSTPPTVTGTDPTGDPGDRRPPPTTSTSFTPAITLDQDRQRRRHGDHPAGDEVTYTYVVTNAGNTPLATVDLADDTPPCTDPTLDRRRQRRRHPRRRRERGPTPATRRRPTTSSTPPTSRHVPLNPLRRQQPVPEPEPAGHRRRHRLGRRRQRRTST